jgi:Cu2+-exporting ATPase
MGVEGDVTDQDIIAAVEKAGSGASVKGRSKAGKEAVSSVDYEDALKDTETPKLRARLLLAF